MQILQGDKVEVINGPEAGKQGLVLAVLRDRNKLIVEGIRKVTHPATEYSL